MNYEKNNGIFYTPSELASFVANLAISSANSTVLDTCYGEGALLLAAHERLLNLRSTAPNRQLFGYDIALPKEGAQRNQLRRSCLSGFLDEKNLKKRDFFSPIERESEERFDVILMNPPFVRHHLIPRERRKTIRSIVGDDARLPMTSDLWAYFVVHSFKFIRKGGYLVSILPWSFLHADFARTVRELLLERFRVLRVVVIGQRMFERAEERILVLIGKGFGFATSDIGIYYSFGVPKKQISWIPVRQKIWRASPWMCLVSSDVHKTLLNVGNSIGFESLSRFAKIQIGTVTGANNFFILKREVAKGMRLPKGILRPIIRHSADLCKLVITASDGIKDAVLLIPEDMKISGPLKEYIKRGERSGVNERYHSRKRVKWYSISIQKPPDGFLHYMTKEVPFLVLNPKDLMCTNTIHQVNFLDGVDENAKKWIQFSMLTSISQLSIELLGRTYGGGVLKIEPTAIKKVLVYPGNGKRFPASLENELNSLLLKGKRREAIELADKWMITNLQVPREDMDFIIKSYRYIRDLRLGKNAQHVLRA